MRHRSPLHIHISRLFLILILIVCVSRAAQSEIQRLIEAAGVVTRLLSLQEVTRVTTLEQRLANLAFLRQTLDSSLALSSLYIGYADGGFFLLGRVGHGSTAEAADVPADASYVVQSIEHAAAEPHGRFIYLDAALRPLREDPRPDYAGSYDPRQRVWFGAAMAATTAIKTAPSDNLISAP